MPTFRFSNRAIWWRPLCTSTLYPELSVPSTSESCEVCVRPIAIEEEEEEPPPCGTSTWEWTSGAWVMTSNDCTSPGGPEPLCVPVEPTDPGSIEGQTTETDCIPDTES